jgi:hypothetical protein
LTAFFADAFERPVFFALISDLIVLSTRNASPSLLAPAHRVFLRSEFRVLICAGSFVSK